MQIPTQFHKSSGVKTDNFVNKFFILCISLQNAEFQLFHKFKIKKQFFHGP